MTAARLAAMLAKVTMMGGDLPAGRWTLFESDVALRGAANARGVWLLAPNLDAAAEPEVPEGPDPLIEALAEAQARWEASEGGGPPAQVGVLGRKVFQRMLVRFAEATALRTGTDDESMGPGSAGEPVSGPSPASAAAVKLVQRGCETLAAVVRLGPERVWTTVSEPASSTPLSAAVIDDLWDHMLMHQLAGVVGRVNSAVVAWTAASPGRRLHLGSVTPGTDEYSELELELNTKFAASEDVWVLAILALVHDDLAA